MGGVIPGVEVSLANPGTGQVFRKISGDSGLFSFADLNSGSYTLQAQLTGFHTWVAKDIKIDTGQDYSLRVRLSVGEVESSVLVPSGLEPQAPLFDPGAAYDAYLRGKYHLSKRTPASLREAAAHFQSSVEIDSSYPFAYVGLADANFLLLQFGEISPAEARGIIREALSKAFELDDSLGEAHVSLANQMTYDWRWVEAEEEYKQALRLYPNSSTAHHRYAVLLQSLGRFEEAIEELQQAKRLDPLSHPINQDLGIALFSAGRYQEAANALRVASELAGLRSGGDILGFSLVALNETEQVEQWLEEVGPSHGAICVLAATARASQAAEMADRLAAPPEESILSNVCIGRNDQAFRGIELLLDQQHFRLSGLMSNPVLAPLREDPRYKATLQKMGYPDADVEGLVNSSLHWP